MKFLITMNMPSNQGKAIHQMIVSRKGINSIDEFLYYVSNNVFICVEEFYFQRNLSFSTAGAYSSRGQIIVNTEYIGKIREAAGPEDQT